MILEEIFLVIEFILEISFCRYKHFVIVGCLIWRYFFPYVHVFKNMYFNLNCLLEFFL